MRDIVFGSIDRREIRIRCYTPIVMSRWDGSEFVLSWSRIFNPILWIKSAMWRNNWRAECRVFKNSNHRCDCQTGNSCDGALMLCGFGAVWWYSRFTGEIPCSCDEMIKELFEDTDCSEATYC